jgi:phosphoglycolate phosphatase-like HAD superfamily hydrolase
MKVVLFDIDGTLLWTDGAGRRAVQRALDEVFGSPVPEGHEFDGKTDPQIVRELMVRAGVDEDAIAARLPEALQRYLVLLHDELSNIDDSQHVFPGITPLLDELEQRDDVLLGLLTGNIQPGAVAKLRAVGIDPDRFKVGAFGSDHASRPELPGIARGRAEALLGHAVAGEDMVVIGDTPADMSCGNGIGARAIGVATGRYSVAQLSACAEGVVFQDLSDTDAVMSAILGAADA